MKDMIEITGIDLKKFAQKVYELSVPQGMGFIHAKSGGLSDEDAQALLDKEKNDSRIALLMDYVHGRACKMTVFKEEGKLFMRDSWYDHSDWSLSQLMKFVNEKEGKIA